MTGGKRFFVMRHAQAAPYAVSDRERELTERGRRDVARAAAYLTAHGVRPDHVLVSSAVRTQQTWAELRQALGVTLEADVDAELYNAEPPTILGAVRAVPASAEVVLFIGHNPAAWYLAGALDDGRGDPELVRRVLTGFAPSSVAGFEVSGDWADLDEGRARLVLLHAGARS